MSRRLFFLGLMLTGTLAAAALLGDESEVADVAEAVSRRNVPAASSVTAGLQLGRLDRDGVDAPERDPFASTTWYEPPPPPPSQPHPVVQEVMRAPEAPAVPFKFIAWMREEDGHEIAYLTDGNRVLTANKGDVLDGTYRVESIAPRKIELVYLPLQAHQTLAVGGGGAMEEGSSPEAGAMLAGNDPAGDVP